MKALIEIRSIVFFGCLFATSYLMATDIAYDVQNMEALSYTKEGGFIEIGLKASTKRNPVEIGNDQAGFSLLLDGRFQWKGLFVEVIEDSSTLFTSGYNAWNNNHWSLDIVVSQIYDDVIDYGSFKEIRIFEGEPENEGIESPVDTAETNLLTSETINNRFKNLRDRNSGFLIGSRATAYYGSYIFQFGLLTDISSRRNDITASIEAGRSWQIRNWNLYALGRARYRTSKVFIRNIEFNEPQEKISAHSFEEIAPALIINETLVCCSKNKTSILALKIGATYPLTENWLFRSSLEHATLSERFFQSPMVMTRNGTSFSTSISYVF